MSKETDQKFAAEIKKSWKWLKIRAIKLGALLCGATAIITLVALAPERIALIAAIPAISAFGLWYEAAKLAGPNLGNAPGRAHMATDDDLEKAGMG